MRFPNRRRVFRVRRPGSRRTARPQLPSVGGPVIETQQKFMQVEDSRTTHPRTQVQDDQSSSVISAAHQTSKVDLSVKSDIIQRTQLQTPAISPITSKEDRVSLHSSSLNKVTEVKVSNKEQHQVTGATEDPNLVENAFHQIGQVLQEPEITDSHRQSPQTPSLKVELLQEVKKSESQPIKIENVSNRPATTEEFVHTRTSHQQIPQVNPLHQQAIKQEQIISTQLQQVDGQNLSKNPGDQHFTQPPQSQVAVTSNAVLQNNHAVKLVQQNPGPQTTAQVSQLSSRQGRRLSLLHQEPKLSRQELANQHFGPAQLSFGPRSTKPQVTFGPLEPGFKPQQQSSQATFSQQSGQILPQKQQLSTPQSFSQGPASQHQVSQVQQTERGEFPAISLSQHSQFSHNSKQGRGQQALVHNSASTIDHFSPQLLHFQHATNTALHPNIQVHFNGASHEAHFITQRTNDDRSQDFRSIDTKTKLASSFQSGGQEKVTTFQADRRASLVSDQPVQHTKPRLPQKSQRQEVSGAKFSGQFSSDDAHLRHELDRSSASHRQEEKLNSQQRRVSIQEEQQRHQELSRRKQQMRAKSKVEQLTRSQENIESNLESNQSARVAESGVRESHSDRFREHELNIRNTQGPSIVNKISRPAERVSSSHDEDLTFTSDHSQRGFHQSESTFRQEKHRANEDEHLRVNEEASFSASPHENFRPTQNNNFRGFQNEQLRGAQEDSLSEAHIDQFKTSQVGIARVSQNNNFRAPHKHFSTADVTRERIIPLQANTYRPTQIEHFTPQQHNFRSQEEQFRAVQGDQNVRLKQREDFRTPQGTPGLRTDQVNFRDQYIRDQQADIRGSHIADFRETQNSNYRDRSGARDQNSEFAGGEISTRNDASRFRGNQYVNLRDRDQFSQFGDGTRENTSRFRGNQQSNFRDGESNIRVTEDSALNFRERISDTMVRPSNFGISPHEDANVRDQRPNLGNRAQNLRQQVTNMRGNKRTNLRTNQHRFSDSTSSFSAAEARFRAQELARLEHNNQNTASRVSGLRDDSRLLGQYSDFTRDEGARKEISSDRSSFRSYGSRYRQQQAPSQTLRRQEHRSRAREGRRHQSAQVRIENPVGNPRTSEFKASLSQLDQNQGVWGSQLQHPYQDRASPDRTSPPTQSSLTPTHPTPNSHFVRPSFHTRQPSDTFSGVKASTFEDRREITGGVSSLSSGLQQEGESSDTLKKDSRSRVRGESVAIADIGSSQLAATGNADNTFQVFKAEKSNDFASQQEERAFTISQSEGFTRSSQDNTRPTQEQASLGHDTRPSPPSPRLVDVDRDVALENNQPRHRPIINSDSQPGFNYQRRRKLTQSQARAQNQDLNQASLKQRTVQTSAKLSSSVRKVDRAPPTPSLINRHQDQTALKTKAQTHIFSQDSKVTRTQDIQYHDYESTEKLSRTHASAPGRGTRKFVDSLPAGVGEGVDDGDLLKSLMVLLRGEDFSSGLSGQTRAENLGFLQPTLPNIPETGFRCRGLSTGYYADSHTDAACTSFHFCGTDGSKSSYLCPTGTAFNQRLQVCDHAFRVDCGRTRDFYPTSSSSAGVERGHQKREAGDEVVEEKEKKQ